MTKNGIVANANKFQFCQENVEFASLTVTSTGVAPSHKILAAIQNFPTPANTTSAHSQSGLINQTQWAYTISPTMQTFWRLDQTKRQVFGAKH